MPGGTQNRWQDNMGQHRKRARQSRDGRSRTRHTEGGAGCVVCNYRSSFLQERPAKLWLLREKGDSKNTWELAGWPMVIWDRASRFCRGLVGCSRRNLSSLDASFLLFQQLQ